MLLASLVGGDVEKQWSVAPEGLKGTLELLLLVVDDEVEEAFDFLLSDPLSELSGALVGRERGEPTHGFVENGSGGVEGLGNLGVAMLLGGAALVVIYTDFGLCFVEVVLADGFACSAVLVIREAVGFCAAVALLVVEEIVEAQLDETVVVDAGGLTRRLTVAAALDEPVAHERLLYADGTIGLLRIVVDFLKSIH